ncbi:1-acyl-sn-glycerol-3-phosphate acyltransferase alpha-like [Eublepharis macularius]|uniref:1-acyl-sn-glycerol-3-phosphate acyltransferase n=1 Tax=Eublepharis macularius TaxID=481883 RepID=A0AA97J8C2_EUBMA|nr:1-acyl-sn-glycerol-3-phosphate acyltransferase alpha-like [Eublepharis macularius]
MALSLSLTNFTLFFTGGLLLYHYSNSFRYYFRVCFLIGWMLGMSLIVLPIVALRGRNVANMRVLRWVMLPLKYILGIKIRVQGTMNLNLEGPYVIVANHQSNVDYLGMLQVLPKRCVLIVTKEIFYMLTVGVVCWLSGFIFIDHKKTADTSSSMAAVADTVVRDNLRVWVFPEGTKNYYSAMLPFKKGAFDLAVKAQVPVVPVVMSSYQHFFNKKIKKFTSGEVTIRILPPMKTEGLVSADVPELTERVWESMLSSFHEISGGKEKQT